ncbi:MAG: hypothetical protein LBM41_06230 [Ruminococcus sp.]|jgi:hypothetical protein|nr:hypothetical protein [Ruminococcus sp.]
MQIDLNKLVENYEKIKPYLDQAIELIPRKNVTKSKNTEEPEENQDFNASLSEEAKELLDELGLSYCKTPTELYITYFALIGKYIDGQFQQTQGMISDVLQGQHDDRSAKISSAYFDYKTALTFSDEKNRKEMIKTSSSKLTEGLSAIKNEMCSTLTYMKNVPDNRIKRLFTFNPTEAKAKLERFKAAVYDYRNGVNLSCLIYQMLGEEQAQEVLIDDVNDFIDTMRDDGKLECCYKISGDNFFETIPMLILGEEEVELNESI